MFPRLSCDPSKKWEPRLRFDGPWSLSSSMDGPQNRQAWISTMLSEECSDKPPPAQSLDDAPESGADGKAAVLAGVGSWPRHEEESSVATPIPSAKASQEEQRDSYYSYSFFDTDNTSSSRSPWSSFPGLGRCASPENANLSDSRWSIANSSPPTARSPLNNLSRPGSIKAESVFSRGPTVSSSSSSISTSYTLPPMPIMRREEDRREEDLLRGAVREPNSCTINSLVGSLKPSATEPSNVYGRINQAQRYRPRPPSKLRREPGADEGPRLNAENYMNETGHGDKTCLSIINESRPDANVRSTNHDQESSEKLQSYPASPLQNNNSLTRRDTGELNNASGSVSALTSDMARSSLDETNSTQKTESTATSISDGIASTTTGEDESSQSDTTDDTDDSLQRMCEESGVPPILIPAIASVWHDLVSVVEARILDWIRSCAPDQGSGDVGDYSGNPGTEQGESSGSGGDRGSKRRAQQTDGGSNSGRGNDDDRGKRQKVESPHFHPAVAQRLFACHYPKKYPDKNWPRCQGGWRQVYRIKDHIYKHHRILYCTRCYCEFNTDEELKQHSRRDEPCVRASDALEPIGIDASIKERLKSRKVGRKGSEETKWVEVWKILFGEDQDIPSPYLESQTAETALGPQEFLRFIQDHQEGITESGANRLAENVLNMRGLPQEEFSNRLRSEIRQALQDVLRQASTRFFQARDLSTPVHSSAPVASPAVATPTDISADTPADTPAAAVTSSTPIVTGTASHALPTIEENVSGVSSTNQPEAIFYGNGLDIDLDTWLSNWNQGEAISTVPVQEPSHPQSDASSGESAQ